MKDAANAVDAIKRALITRDQTLKSAVDTYESEMKSRGVREVNLSLEQARKASISSDIKDSPIFKIGWKPGEVKNEADEATARYADTFKATDVHRTQTGK